MIFVSEMTLGKFGERFLLQNNDICKRNATGQMWTNLTGVFCFKMLTRVSEMTQTNWPGVFYFKMMTFVSETRLGKIGGRFLLQNDDISKRNNIEKNRRAFSPSK